MLDELGALVEAAATVLAGKGLLAPVGAQMLRERGPLAEGFAALGACVYMNNYSSLMHKSPKAETTQRSIN